MVEALVTTYWHAKTERPEVTRALYRSVAEIDSGPLMTAFAARADAATSAMLQSASDASFAHLATVNLTLLATVFGTVRNLFERDLPLDAQVSVRDQLIAMCDAYLLAVRVAQRGSTEPHVSTIWLHADVDAPEAEASGRAVHEARRVAQSSEEDA